MLRKIQSYMYKKVIIRLFTVFQLFGLLLKISSLKDRINLFQKDDNICLKCGRLSYFSAKPSVAEITTLDKVTRFEVRTVFTSIV